VTAIRQKFVVDKKGPEDRCGYPPQVVGYLRICTTSPPLWSAELKGP